MLIYLICTLIVLTHVFFFRPNLHILHETQLCGFGSSVSTSAKADLSSASDYKFASTNNKPLIPPKIWQNYFGDDLDEDNLFDAASWLALNKDYAYTLIGKDGADNFINKHFADDPPLLRRYHSLPNFGMKSDLLRYLVLSVEGGVYTDIDTIALRPIKEWVPPSLRHLVRVIVGIEFDQRDGGLWADIPHELQFCQWTLAAAGGGHPLFDAMVARALDSFTELERRHNTTLARLQPANIDVLNTTGPAAWTDVVFEHLRRGNPDLVSLRNFSYMEEPTLYGDILILPIDGFGMGQPHSGSSGGDTIPDVALVKHNFRGKWRQSD